MDEYPTEMFKSFRYNETTVDEDLVEKHYNERYPSRSVKGEVKKLVEEMIDEQKVGNSNKRSSTDTERFQKPEIDEIIEDEKPAIKKTRTN